MKEETVASFKQIMAEQPDIQQAVEQHAVRDLANVPEATQEQGTFAKVAAEIMEVLPTAKEVGAELGNRVEEAKSFLGNMLEDIGSELGRLGVQGQAELASALFNGNSYVPYGEGQRSPRDAEPDHGLPEQQKEQERGMEMEM